MRLRCASEIEGIGVHVLVFEFMDGVGDVMNRGRMIRYIGALRLSRIKYLRRDLF